MPNQPNGTKKGQPKQQMGNRHPPKMNAQKSRDEYDAARMADDRMREKRERSYEKMYQKFQSGPAATQ